MRQLIINDDLKTHDNWELILTSQFIPAPEVKTRYIDTPYTQGFIDYSEHDGEVFYGSRECEFQFDLLENHDTRESVISEIMAKVHGKIVTILAPDQEHELIGRATIEVERLGASRARVTINQLARPFLRGSVKEATVNAKTALEFTSGGMTTTYQLEIKPQSTSSELEVTTNGDKLTINKEVGSGDVITIDTEHTEIRVNDELQVLEVDGAMGTIKNGDNEIEVNVSSDMTINYREWFL